MRRTTVLILVAVLALLVGTGVLSYLRAPVLGLDLQGGAEVTLEAQPQKGQAVTDEQMNQAVQILRTRVDALGVAEPQIQREQGNRITIAVAGEKDPARVFALVGSTGQLYFIDLEQGLTQGVSRSFVAGAGIVPKTSLYELLKAVPKKLQSGDQSIYYAFKKGDTAQPLNPNGAVTMDQLLLQLGEQSVPADVEVLSVPAEHIAVKCSNQSPAGCPPNITPITTKAKEKFFWYMFDLPPVGQRLTGDDLESAKSDFDTQTGQPVVLMNFNDRGAKLFGDITKQLADRGRSEWSAAGAQAGQESAYFQRFAIILDGGLETYPTIDFVQNPDGITGGSAQITGLASPQEASDIALVLQSGSLPVRFVALSSSQVSATLGEASLRQGLIAGLIGLLLMMLYLIIFYRVLGVVAAFALIIFAALFYGVILAVPITMTLPGIAGMILTIGVAADANIVVFERVREEFRAGKSLKAAISAGYSRGFRTILDANAVTLITAGVLFVASQSSVKGFAFLLAIGVLVSMFTSVVATRAILNVLSNFSWFNNPRVIGAEAKPVRWRFDFAGRKRLFFTIAAVAVAICVGALFIRGLNLGLDFTGGTRMAIVTQKAATPDEIKALLVKADGELSGSIVRGEGAQSGSTYTTFQVDAKEIPAAKVQTIEQSVNQQYGLAEQVDVRTVSASFGSEILRGALLALVFSIFLIVIYMALRFDWKFAVPMIVALLHDLVIALGVYALSGREVTSATIAALLTILGYSLYDTIIVFDRVRENEKVLRRQTYDQIVNISLWETATRSLNTSFATLLPILALFFFGGATLQDFAFALIVGIAVGAYSSFFVASPLLSVLKSREPEYRGRKGSTELPAFMLGKAGAEHQKVAVAAGVDEALAVEAEEILDNPDGPPATPEATPPAATATGAGPDDAAIEAARQRRANRRGKKR
ncbi:MAG: protein translocase subunit SecD [Thermoleophilia bacterium]